MTTEILRSMLYRGSSTTCEAQLIVFDEIHYLRSAADQTQLAMGVCMFRQTPPGGLESSQHALFTCKRRRWPLTDVVMLLLPCRTSRRGPDSVKCCRDKERGVVWEECIIMMPKQARFVFLSATIPNAREFADWIAKIHRCGMCQTHQLVG